MRIPISFCGIPTWLEAISERSSTMATFNGTHPMPYEICLIISRRIVVLPQPGGDTTSVFLNPPLHIKSIISSAHPTTSCATRIFIYDIYFCPHICPSRVIACPATPMRWPPFTVTYP